MFKFWSKLSSLNRCLLAPNRVAVSALMACIIASIQLPATAQTMPDNAQLNYLGTGWECIRGYRKELNRCERVVLPENAKLDYLGNNWECIRGYRKTLNRCEQVILPENAKLNYLGNDWECSKGFAKAGQTCRAMSASELKTEAEIEEQVEAMMLARAARSRGGECQIESDTGSEVCISLDDAELDCSKRYSDDYYRSCIVEIEYEFTNDYRGSSSLSAYFECEAEIKYQTADRSTKRTMDEDDSASETLYANYASTGSIEIDFSFPSSHEVQQVELLNAACSITSLGR